MKLSKNELEKAYKKAVKEKSDRLDIKGHVLLTDYAKYLLEYLEDLYKRRDMKGSEKFELTQQDEVSK